MPKENQIQAELIRLFGQKYPRLRRLLFEVNNDTFSLKHNTHRRAMGMIEGVSDLVFIGPYNQVACFELKAPGSTHDAPHIKNQLEWGALVMKTGAFYLMATEIKTPLLLIEGILAQNKELCAMIQETNKAYIEAVIEPQLKAKKSVKF